jgi:formylglycine-generating enzyme required for sulfatase activity
VDLVMRRVLITLAVTVACDRSEVGVPILAASAPTAPASLAPAPAPSAPACPAEMALVAGSCVDRYEAHLVSTHAPADRHSPYERPRPDQQYRAVSTAGVVPQAYLSRIEAAAACHNAGKRLCRADEWLRACEGTPSDAARCNLGKPHLLPRLFGTRTKLTFDLHYNSPRLNQEPGFLGRTGEHSGCVNQHGLFDMVGNLHEWVADDVSRALTRRVPMPYGHQRMGPRGSGVFMGGYFSSEGEHGDGCRYMTTSHRPDYHDYSIGFRCCAAPR